MQTKAPRVREVSPRVAAVAPHRLPDGAAARPEPAAGLAVGEVAGDAVKQAVKQRRRGRRKIEEKKG